MAEVGVSHSDVTAANKRRLKMTRSLLLGEGLLSFLRDMGHGARGKRVVTGTTVSRTFKISSVIYIENSPSRTHHRELALRGRKGVHPSVQNPFEDEQDMQRDVRERMSLIDAACSQGDFWAFERTYKDEDGKPYPNVLTMEFAEDGRTLLEFVVFSRRPKEEIQTVVEDIIYYVGLNALVFQLHKSDAWGAPLLFQAVSGQSSGQGATLSSRNYASCRHWRERGRSESPLQIAAQQTRAECFVFVAEIISRYLYQGGLAKQLRSVDREGQSLRMYAARSDEEGLYEEVEKLMKDQHLSDNLKHRDNRGYTLLYHTAESGNLAKLKVVTASLRTLPYFRNKFLGVKNRYGMTPAQCLLSRQVGERELDECENKVKHLMNVCICPENPENPCTEESCPETSLKGLDDEGVIFAARGGMRNLLLAIRLWEQSQSSIPSHWQQAPLRSKLECIFGNESRNADEVERLLVQAALGGQGDVLQAVLEAASVPPENGDVIPGNEGTSFAHGGAVPNRGVTPSDDGNTDGDRRGSRGGGGGSNSGGSIWDSLRDTAKVMKSRDFRFTAFELGYVGDEPEGGNEDGREDCKGSLFTLTILSGKESAISWAKDYTLECVTQGTEAWDIIRGEGCLSSLTYAASAPPETGTAAFKAVLTALEEAAEGAEGVRDAPHDAIRQEFEGRGKNFCQRERLPPLAAAAFCGNEELFLEVQKAYITRFHGTWCPDEILHQLLTRTLIRRKSCCIGWKSLLRWKTFIGCKCLIGRESSKSVCQQKIRFFPREGDDEARIPTAMWSKIMDMATEFRTCHHSRHLLDEWKRLDPLVAWKASFTNSIKQAVAQGGFEHVRALIRMKFRMEDIIPSLLADIGDNEEGLTSTIMWAITLSSNPFTMCAVASRHITDTKAMLPAYREGLDRLQTKVDEFTMELLNNLPRTVRDFGRKLVGTRPPTTYKWSSGRWRKRRERLSYLVGYMLVGHLLEPNQGPMFQGDERAVKRECVDPIQQAMERSSWALYFMNSPLVRDYMRITFSRTLPHWMVRDPFRHYIDIGLHRYFPGFGIHGENALLRTMQGWEASRTGELRMPKSAFPPSMILPGLQFSLAGIIGKPDAFFMVPAVRFAFMFLGYVVTVALYVSCLPPEDSDDIPPNEIVFYIFGMGLLYLEILEFQETLPHQNSMYNHGDYLSKEYKWSLTRRLWYTATRHRVSVALTRYLFHDTWNILDALTINTILMALVTRLMGMGGRWSSGDEDDDSATDDASLELEFARWSFFLSRYALASVAPMLLARFLFLSQIDATLGPMTQVIWTMIFHLARFSFFLLVHLIGFALTFYALFSDCEGDLGDRFHAFSTSLMTLFRSMLGDFDFDMFSDGPSGCEGSSYAAYEIGIFLMVVYIVVMSILLLNLLIAVLSTAHSEVHKNSVPEFHLAAGKIMFKNAKAVARGLVPPPFNLLIFVIALLVDVAGLLYSLPSTLRLVRKRQSV